MIILAVAGWRYVPENVKAVILNTVGIAARRDTDEVKHFIEDVVLPKDPAARRSALTGELEKNIAELQRRIEGDKNGIAVSGASAPDVGGSSAGVPDAKIRAASSEELITAAAGIVKELENANSDTSVGRKAAERILDTVLPAPVCHLK